MANQKYDPASIEKKWPHSAKASRGKQEYRPSEIEVRWQQVWEELGVYKTPENPSKKKYILDMYPYPSGASMHVGHVEGYVGTDILSRYFRMKGFDVLHPMGWDSFGLPAENYAINTGVPPAQSTEKNIQTFKRQLQSAGLSYDWDREITSSDPNYYKWNQWLFIQLFKKGLAYKKEAKVNWCPSCETVLANEQVIEGKCERCESEVIQKDLSQWFLKITAYADRLIEGLDELDWLKEVKVQQVNWIGKKEGIEIEYEVVLDETGAAKLHAAAAPSGSSRHPSITVFTTRPDTNFGATFVVIAPEHPQVMELTTGSNKEVVSKYIESVKSKSDEERIAEGRKKTGIFTGSYAINQLTGEKMPIWVSDFVLAGFGTGAVVGVPGHDRRDFDFAKEFDLPMKRVVVGSDGDTSEITRVEQVQEEEGKMVNSGFLDGMGIREATQKIMDYMEEKGWGKRVTTYHLRDWLISRQRYWGTPIPMLFCSSCEEQGKSWFDTEEAKNMGISNFQFLISNKMPGWYPVPESDLPVLLPHDVDFRPTGQSPITRSKTFQEGVRCPGCGGEARREVDTMDGYVDSSWYFIRFADPKNMSEFASQDEINKWLPVDIYVGGGHVVQHLLFARFFWKFMFDEGLVDKSLGDEPFLKLRAPGWILGPDSRKMSKRWGNVITPDDIVPKYGADTLRMYEMFMGPFEAAKPWSLTGVEGMHRFVKRVWVLADRISSLEVPITKEEQSRSVYRKIHQTIKRVTEDIEELKFNTAISALMEYVNFLEDLVGDLEGRGEKRPANAAKVKCAELEEAGRTLLLLLAPFAPHMAEELWQARIKNKELGIKGKSEEHNSSFVLHNSVHAQAWPTFDPELIKEATVEIPVQVNGRLRGTVIVQSAQAGVQSEVEGKARENEGVAKYLEGQKVSNVVFVPGRLINFVV